MTLILAVTQLICLLTFVDRIYLKLCFWNLMSLTSSNGFMKTV